MSSVFDEATFSNCNTVSSGPNDLPSCVTQRVSAKESPWLPTTTRPSLFVVFGLSSTFIVRVCSPASPLSGDTLTQDGFSNTFQNDRLVDIDTVREAAPDSKSNRLSVMSIYKPDCFTGISIRKSPSTWRLTAPERSSTPPFSVTLTDSSTVPAEPEEGLT